MKFPHYTQASMMDCGPTCLSMIAKYYGKSISQNKLAELSQIGKDGVNVLGKAQQKQIKGSGPCGVKTSDGDWSPMVDANGSGTTKEEALKSFNDGYANGTSGNYYDVVGWCCDSCPWN